MLSYKLKKFNIRRMKVVKIIKKIPVPMAALMLSFAALGNLIQTYSETLRTILGAISIIIAILLTVKFLTFPKLVGEELKNPVAASVLPAYSMGIMLIATYLKPLNAQLGSITWYIGVLIHIILMIDFTIKYVFKFDLKKVFASWFIVYVGLAVASVTAPAFDRSNIGRIIFWFALIAYFILMFLVIKRYKNFKDIPEPARPTFAILAAPASLCLAGYMSSFENKSLGLVYLLLILAQVTYFLVLSQLGKLLKSKFYPSFAAFTFPLVISGIGLKLTNKFLVESNKGIAFLKYLVKFEELVAVLIVFYVTIKYIAFLSKKEA